MKIFTNSKFLKKIAIFLIIITLCSFVMPTNIVKAETFTEDANEVPGRKNVKSYCAFINVYR